MLEDTNSLGGAQLFSSNSHFKVNRISIFLNQLILTLSDCDSSETLWKITPERQHQKNIKVHNSP